MPVDESSTTVRVAIVGDFQPDHETHPATAAAVGHASDHLGRGSDAVWIPTPEVEGCAADALAGFHGVWIAPGSPYASMQGALDAIAFARAERTALLGTCAGFQHIVIELGRNVLGLAGAGHEESDPDAPELMISALACSLAGQTFTVRLIPGSAAASAYGVDEADERYYCSFGLNPRYVAPLAAAGLVVTGIDHDGEPRIVELVDHPFLVGTLFVPQMRSGPGRPHPLIESFVRSAIHRADGEAAHGAASS